MAISLRIAGVLTLVALSASACQTTPRLAGRDTQTISGALERLNPSDIAIAPIRYGAAGVDAPEGDLRRAAQLGLARRRYSPLSLGLVDDTIDTASRTIAATGGAATLEGGLLEASYAAGDVGEDAVLEVTVHQWDNRHWNTRRSLDVVVEARMVDPADPFGPPLWAGRLEKFVDVSGVGGLDSSGRRSMESACNTIFRELFAKMPARNTDPLSGLDDPAGGTFSGSSTDGPGDGL